MRKSPVICLALGLLAPLLLVAASGAQTYHYVSSTRRQRTPQHEDFGTDYGDTGAVCLGGR